MAAGLLYGRQLPWFSARFCQPDLQGDPAMTETPDPLAAFLARHSRCQLCRICGNAVTAATHALPPDRGKIDDASVPFTFEARAPLCGWCAWLVRRAAVDGHALCGVTAKGHLVDPQHAWDIAH